MALATSSATLGFRGIGAAGVEPVAICRASLLALDVVVHSLVYSHFVYQAVVREGEFAMIVIHCRFGIDPRDREAWTESAKRMATLSRAEEGCIAYDFSFDVIDPNVAYV